MSGTDLAVFETHPIQYHAPVYRDLQQRLGIRTAVVYGSDFSIAGGIDREFGIPVTWDVDLTTGYEPIFLSRVAQKGARTLEEVSPQGIPEAIERLRPRAILAVGYGARYHQAALWHAWKSRKPILFRGETAARSRPRLSLRGYARDVILRAAYRRCARLLYIGQCSKEHYLRLGCPEEKLVFSPYCVDTSPFACGEDDRARFREGTRQKLGLAPQDVALLFSGKLVRRKNPQALLDAARLLDASMRSRIVALFLGEGQEKGSLVARERRAGDIRIRLLDFQNQTQLSPYYHAADLMVLPSSWGETWGLVVNEALHHGLPCVVSDEVPCRLDLIEPGKTGEICPPRSAEALADAIRRALSWAGNPETRASCRQRVSGYTVGKTAEGIASAFHAVIGEEGRSS